MSRLIGIFGTSGQARECADIADALGFGVFFVGEPGQENEIGIKGARVISEEEVGQIENAEFIIGIGDGKVRREIAGRFPTLSFCNLIHPAATMGIGQRQELDKCTGTIVSAGVRLSNNIRVGNFSLFNLNSTVSHDCAIGDFSTISPSVSIAGNVVLGDCVFVGIGANISNGKSDRKLKIHSGTVIGAGAVVIEDCDGDSTYAGVPAVRIK